MVPAPNHGIITPLSDAVCWWWQKGITFVITQHLQGRLSVGHSSPAMMNSHIMATPPEWCMALLSLLPRRRVILYEALLWGVCVCVCVSGKKTGFFSLSSVRIQFQPPISHTPSLPLLLYHVNFSQKQQSFWSVSAELLLNPTGRAHPLHKLWLMVNMDSACTIAQMLARFRCELLRSPNLQFAQTFSVVPSEGSKYW